MEMTPRIPDAKDSNNRIMEKEVTTGESGYHGKIDWNVAKRFLKAIYEEGEIKKTKLAMRSGVNYGTCIRYIKWMEELGWIAIKDNDLQIKISEPGIQMYRRLESRGIFKYLSNTRPYHLSKLANTDLV